MHLEVTISSDEDQVLQGDSVLDVIDPQLEAILDDALMDFLCVKDVHALETVQGPKVEACDNTLEAGGGEILKEESCMDKVDFGSNGPDSHVDGYKEVEVVIKNWCSKKMLMERILRTTLQHATCAILACFEEIFCEVFSQWVFVGESQVETWSFPSYEHMRDPQTRRGLDEPIFFDTGMSTCSMHFIGRTMHLVFDPRGWHAVLKVMKGGYPYWPFDPGI